METFSLWAIFREASQELIPDAILRGYDLEFKKALTALIQRTKDPVLREKFEKMLTCPVVDAKGGCRSFTDYILSTLIRNGIHQRFDIEDSLSYVVSKMLMPRGETGEPRTTLFSDFDESRPYTTGFNPLQARFVSFLKFAVNNIRRNRIPRLASAQRPAGTTSIGVGRTSKDEPSTGISPEAIPSRSSTDADLNELVEDIIGLLRQKAAIPGGQQMPGIRHEMTWPFVNFFL